MKDINNKVNEAIEIYEMAKKDLATLFENRFQEKETTTGQIGAYYTTIAELAFIICCHTANEAINNGFVSRDRSNEHMENILIFLRKRKNKIMGIDSEQ